MITKRHPKKVPEVATEPPPAPEPEPTPRATGGKPAYQVLQEEWNTLVPFAQAAGIPRVRTRRVGPGISYRPFKEKLEEVKAQLRRAVGEARLAEILSGAAKPPPELPSSARRATQASPERLTADTALAMELDGPDEQGLSPTPQEYKRRRELRARSASQTPGYIDPAISPSSMDDWERGQVRELGLVVADDRGQFLVTDPVARKHFAFRDASKRGQYRGSNFRSLLVAVREVRATIEAPRTEEKTDAADD